jgi:hypothetical protein
MTPSHSSALSNSALRSAVLGLGGKIPVAAGQRRLAVLVAGMHRSGTSAVAGCLAASGIPMGERLMPPTDDNPKGYFEHLDVVALHEAVLRALGRSWDDPRALPEGWLDRPMVREVEKAMADWIERTFATAPVFAIKDPRISRLLPLWSRVFHDIGIDVQVLHVLRHPAEVASSLFARDRMPSTVALLLWCAYNVDIAAQRSALRTTLVRYPEIVGAAFDWIPAGLSNRAGSDTVVAAAAVKAFLDPALRRQASRKFDSAVLPGLVDVALGLDAAFRGQRNDLDFMLARWRDTIAPLLDAEPATEAR